MDYSQTLDFLYSSLPMYQRIGKAAYKSDLDTSIKLDNHFNNPHKSFRSIHIAGTNGKGSVSHILASVLQQAGYVTGLYTSPHLTDFRERIKLNGKMIEKQYIIDFIASNREIIDRLKPSFFEMTVAMACKYFKDQNVDIAVVETGMGGRLDSTNILFPEVSVITNIGLDHTQYLGDTFEKIAAEKAGIIKKGIPVIIGESGDKTKNVFIAKAKEMASEIVFADMVYRVDNPSDDLSLYPGPHSNDGLGFYPTPDTTEQGIADEDMYYDYSVYNVYRKGKPHLKGLETDMKGDYQKQNITTVFQVIENLQAEYDISEDMIRKGLATVSKSTGLAGRWQIIQRSPLVICDSAHNHDGMVVAVRQLKRYKTKRIHFILGMVDDKDHDNILSILPADTEYYFTRAEIPRSLDALELHDRALKHGLKGSIFKDVNTAYMMAMERSSADDLVFIGGSTFVVADFLKCIKTDISN